jgi:hypothetical protein
MSPSNALSHRSMLREIVYTHLRKHSAPTDDIELIEIPETRSRGRRRFFFRVAIQAQAGDHAPWNAGVADETSELAGREA